MNREHINDYLWNRSGEVDPLVAELERKLAPLQYAAPRATAIALMPLRARTSRATLSAAASIVLAIIGAWIAAIMLDHNERGALNAWHVTALSGSPRIGSNSITQQARLRAGQWIHTDSQSQARLAVANIGNVTIEPNSRLRLVHTDDTLHRLELARGNIEAFITAPPRLFLVDTPAATAVDLGCKYRLQIDEGGSGSLEVTLGWVSLEREGSASIVPFGAACRIHKTSGPGTPYYADASESFRNALHELDFENGGDSALQALLDACRPRDALTLWHLLPRVQGEARTRIFANLVAHNPLPNDVDTQRIMRGEARALHAWANTMNWSPPSGAMPFGD